MPLSNSPTGFGFLFLLLFLPGLFGGFRLAGGEALGTSVEPVVAVAGYCAAVEWPSSVPVQDWGDMEDNGSFSDEGVKLGLEDADVGSCSELVL